MPGIFLGPFPSDHIFPSAFVVEFVTQFTSSCNPSNPSAFPLKLAIISNPPSIFPTPPSSGPKASPIP